MTRTRSSRRPPSAAEPSPRADIPSALGGDTRDRARSASAHLKQLGLKRSSIRDVIVEEFFRAGHHLTIEDLLRRVRGAVPATGYSTVYRTLRLLVEQGLATERDFGGGQTLFEPADVPHHDHAVCNECGHVTEFGDEALERLQREIARRLGFEATSHRLELYGRCAQCASTAGASKLGRASR